MVEKKIVVCLQHGVQARVATEFVRQAAFFSSDINVVKNGTAVDGKSIMGVMALAIGKGEEIKLTAHGRDEQEAIEALEGLLSSK